MTTTHRPLSPLRALLCASVCALLCTSLCGCQPAEPAPSAPKPSPRVIAAQPPAPVEDVVAVEDMKPVEDVHAVKAAPDPLPDPLPTRLGADPDADPAPDAPPDTAEGTEPPPAEPSEDDAPTKPKRKGRQLLRVSHLLDRLEVREVFRYDATLSDATFPGQEASSTYNAHRLQPSDSASLGFAVQLWELPSQTRALEQFEALFSQSVGGVKTKDAADRSFRISHHKLRSLVFLDLRHQAVVWLSCDEKLCSFDQITQLAQRVRKRL
jgi:hypothetical protein